MKQNIKVTAILFLLMILFNTSQEKECTSITKCIADAPAAPKKAVENINTASDDELVPLSPISRFILIKY